MTNYEIYLGAKPNITLELPEDAKAGEKYIVDIQVRLPDGNIVSDQVTYTILGEIK